MSLNGGVGVDTFKRETYRANPVLVDKVVVGYVESPMGTVVLNRDEPQDFDTLHGDTLA